MSVDPLKKKTCNEPSFLSEPRVNVAKLQQQLQFAWTENDQLKKENAILKQTIRAALAYWPTKIPEVNLDVEPEQKERWPERSEHFDQIRNMLLEVAADRIRKEGKAIGYDPIIRAFQARHRIPYGNMKNPQDTLSRRLRELRDAGYLVSPIEGMFFLGPRLVKGEQHE